MGSGFSLDGKLNEKWGPAKQWLHLTFRRLPQGTQAGPMTQLTKPFQKAPSISTAL